MAVRETTYDAGPDSIPPRARFGFRISKSQRPFELPWQVEVWGKPPHVYAKTESQSLFDAVRMMIIARTHKSKEGQE
jgi:hypothetical protein